MTALLLAALAPVALAQTPPLAAARTVVAPIDIVATPQAPQVSVLVTRAEVRPPAEVLLAPVALADRIAVDAARLAAAE